MRLNLLRWLAPAVLVLFAARASANPASHGTVVLTGNADAKKRTTAVAAVTSALRQAKWSLVDSTFNSKDVQGIAECFQQDPAWPCIEPIATTRDISRLVLIDLTLEKPGTVRMVAQLAASGESVSGYKEGYCSSPCSDSSLAQSATDLVNRLLSDVAARKGSTFIEVVSEPAGAAVMIDGRQVGPAGQRFPVHEGRHRVLVQLSGHRDADTQVDVVEGETKRVTLKLDPLETKVVGPVDTGEPPRMIQWALIGGGAGLLIGGSLVSYFTALDSAPPPGEPRDTEWLYNGKALAVAGIGGAVAVAGLVWMWRTPKSDSKPTISLNHDSAQVGWSINF